MVTGGDHAALGFGLVLWFFESCGAAPFLELALGGVWGFPAFVFGAVGVEVEAIGLGVEGGAGGGLEVVVVGLVLLALVGEAEEGKILRPGLSFGGVGGEFLGGLGGGEGEVEVGLEAEGLLEGLEGGAEGSSAEPAAEDGGCGPLVGGRAGGVVAEGSEENGLCAGGAFHVSHKCLLFLWLWFWVGWDGRKKPAEKRPGTDPKPSLFRPYRVPV
jgi:hypothetical protein